MNIFSKIVKQNPNTILGKAMETFKKDIGPLSFLVYMIPLMILIILWESNNPNASLPNLYTFLIGWYFVALFLLNKIELKNQVVFEFIQMVVCLPVYLSVAITYLLIKSFINKKKYPDITEDELPLHERKIKLKKIKKKIYG